jgi:TonB family protein
MINDEKHLTTGDIEAYLNGEMTLTEVNLLENHANECSFCNDALEGIELMAVPKITNQLKHNLKGKINKRINQEPAKLLMPVGQLVGIAASLLLIFSISFFLIHQSLKVKSESVAAVSSEKEDFNPDLVQDSTVILKTKVNPKETILAYNKPRIESDIIHSDLKIPSIQSNQIEIDKAQILAEKIEFKKYDEEKVDIVLNDNLDEINSIESIPIQAYIKNKDSESKIFQPENIQLITGSVSDKSGQILPGVGISIKGLNTGTSTDVNGNFALNNVKVGQTLVVSFVGMKSVEIRVQKANQSFKILMDDDTQALSEVVVVGYSDTRPNRMIEPVMGWNEFKKYIKNNLKFPEEAIANQIKGKVILNLEVSNNGTVESTSLLKKLGFGCDEESLRLLKDVQWVPAYQEGEKVRSTIRIAVKFGN